MTCPYTGCNMPEGECLGECLNKESVVSEKIESRGFGISLEYLAASYGMAWSAQYGNLKKLIADPAILAHIPAYAELDERFDERNRVINEQHAQIAALREELHKAEQYNSERTNDVMRANTRIATLEAEVERLRGDLGIAKELESMLRESLTAANEKLAQGGTCVGEVHVGHYDDQLSRYKFFASIEWNNSVKNGVYRVYTAPTTQEKA